MRRLELSFSLKPLGILGPLGSSMAPHLRNNDESTLRSPFCLIRRAIEHEQLLVHADGAFQVCPGPPPVLH